MGRHRNYNWDLPTMPDGQITEWNLVPIAVLMDIRDELQKLNSLLHCKNFIAIPNILREIQANTKKTRRRRKPAHPR